jgi:hypothetical protein
VAPSQSPQNGYQYPEGFDGQALRQTQSRRFRVCFVYIPPVLAVTLAITLIPTMFLARRSKRAADDPPTRLEGVIREAVAANDHERVEKIVKQLCHDYAYSVHQPHARNGGLIGLAAAAIALGQVWPWQARILAPARMASYNR